jgi:hypothetical protein
MKGLGPWGQQRPQGNATANNKRKTSPPFSIPPLNKTSYNPFPNHTSELNDTMSNSGAATPSASAGGSRPASRRTSQIYPMSPPPLPLASSSGTFTGTTHSGSHAFPPLGSPSQYVDAAGVPMRHPRPLTAAELHLELEKEQEAVVCYFSPLDISLTSALSSIYIARSCLPIRLHIYITPNSLQVAMLMGVGKPPNPRTVPTARPTLRLGSLNRVLLYDLQCPLRRYIWGYTSAVE